MGVSAVVAGGLEFTWGATSNLSAFCKGFFVVRSRWSRFPHCRAAPVPSGPVDGDLRPPFLVERGLIVVAVVVRVSDIVTAVKRNEKFYQQDSNVSYQSNTGTSSGC